MTRQSSINHLRTLIYVSLCACAMQLYEQRVKSLLETKQMTDAQLQLHRVRQTRAEFFNILRHVHTPCFQAVILDELKQVKMSFCLYC